MDIDGKESDLYSNLHDWLITITKIVATVVVAFFMRQIYEKHFARDRKTFICHMKIEPGCYSLDITRG